MRSASAKKKPGLPAAKPRAGPEGPAGLSPGVARGKARNPGPGDGSPGGDPRARSPWTTSPGGESMGERPLKFVDDGEYC
jgi:hypothetical protein